MYFKINREPLETHEPINELGSDGGHPKSGASTYADTDRARLTSLPVDTLLNFSERRESTLCSQLRFPQIPTRTTDDVQWKKSGMRCYPKRGWLVFFLPSHVRAFELALVLATVIVVFSCASVLLAMTMGSAAGLAPATIQQRAEQSQFASGRTLLSEGHPLEALAVFQNLLQASPGNEQGELGLAESYRQLGNDEEARRVLKQACREHPKSAIPLTTLAELEMGSQNFADAQADAERALHIEPGNPVAHLDLATARQAQGDGEAALREIEVILSRSSPESTDIAVVGAYYLRAQIYAERNQDAKALSDLERVIAAAPDNLRARVLLGKVGLRLNECQKVISALEPLVSSQESDADSLYMLSRAYRCAGKEELADRMLHEYQRRSIDEHARHSREYDAARLTEQAGMSARNNRLDEALELVGQALTKDPQNGDALILRAEIYYSQDKLGEARASAEQALSVNPHNPQYLHVMGTILDRQGDLDAALRCLIEATEVNPRESQAFYEMGSIYLKQKDLLRARSAFKSAVEIDPRNAEYRKALKSVGAD
jgi:tetratricopeptide (TPR) repeat protein